jgi:hypothetical protein
MYIYIYIYIIYIVLGSFDIASWSPSPVAITTMLARDFIAADALDHEHVGDNAHVGDNGHVGDNEHVE